MAKSMVSAPPATKSFRAKHNALYASERDCTRYDASLCRRQDHAGNVLAAIRELLPLTPSLRVVDIGTGTGKLARLLAPHVHSVSAFDRSDEMVAAARAATSASNVTYGTADVRRVPLPDGCAGLVVAGWAISYLKAEHEVWYRDGSSGGPWREEVDAALAEMQRLLAPGGVAVILETHGTACEAPQRSGSWLYAHFRERGFRESCAAPRPNSAHAHAVCLYVLTSVPLAARASTGSCAPTISSRAAPRR